MMDVFGGAYPLAIAAYNAGPGNVNKWLHANGDPRQGTVGWIVWVERIPVYETRNYVQRVIENASVYEHLYPANARSLPPLTVESFLLFDVAFFPLTSPITVPFITPLYSFLFFPFLFPSSSFFF